MSAGLDTEPRTAPAHRSPSPGLEPATSLRLAARGDETARTLPLRHINRQILTSFFFFFSFSFFLYFFSLSCSHRRKRYHGKTTPAATRAWGGDAGKRYRAAAGLQRGGMREPRTEEHGTVPQAPGCLPRARSAPASRTAAARRAEDGGGGSRPPPAPPHRRPPRRARQRQRQWHGGSPRSRDRGWGWGGRRHPPPPALRSPERALCGRPSPRARGMGDGGSGRCR